MKDNKHYKSKLSTTQMKRMSITGVPNIEIAKKAGITAAYVSVLDRGKYSQRLAANKILDSEADCLIKCLKLLSGLPDKALVRVVRYLKEKFLS